MRICIYSDNHFSQYSSILTLRGDTYSYRLENQIKSINWIESIAESRNCEKVICLGDFFNDSKLNAEEITALQDISWSKKLEHIFLVGNHEMSMHTSDCSTMHLFRMLDNARVIDKPTADTVGDIEFLYLPYILEDDRKFISTYVGDINRRRIILSHNDLKGIQMGRFISKNGFDIDDLSNNSIWTFNGHIHNQSCNNGNVINVGNLTGQNFSEDGFKYPHGCIFLDTDTMRVEFEINPYAINFYKVDLSSIEDIYYNCKLDELCKSLYNAVLSIKVPSGKIEYTHELLKSYPNIITYRVQTAPNLDKKETKVEKITSIDHIEQFREYVMKNFNLDEVTLQELDEVCK